MTDRDWEAAIRRDHWCACMGCNPSLRIKRPGGELQRVGVRFWGASPIDREEWHDAVILLDGLAVGGVYEAVLGDEGAIWAFRSVPWTDARGVIHIEGYHPCLTCRDAAQRAGALSPDGFVLRRAADGTEEQVPLELCSLKRTGRVELRRPAATVDAE